MMALKEYREFYMAERNIMLAVSALFIFFVFQRIFYNIRKFSETEAEVAKLKINAWFRLFCQTTINLYYFYSK